jgi:NAD(P)-dependent dehydrogenase (short-subunit alcohol dehydrogenase family)
VNNSGATWGEPLANYPDQAWSKLLTLNVQRVFTLTQKLLPLLKAGAKQDGVGRIINVSLSSSPNFRGGGAGRGEGVVLRILADRQIGSINGEAVPGLETYAYSASKAALHQYVGFFTQLCPTIYTSHDAMSQWPSLPLPL